MATAPELAGVTGKYWANCHKATAKNYVLSEENGKRLWRMSLQLAKIKDDKLKLADDLPVHEHDPNQKIQPQADDSGSNSETRKKEEEELSRSYAHFLDDSESNMNLEDSSSSSSVSKGKSKQKRTH